jgi:hypothetical protein
MTGRHGQPWAARFGTSAAENAGRTSDLAHVLIGEPAPPTKSGAGTRRNMRASYAGGASAPGVNFSASPFMQ